MLVILLPLSFIELYSLIRRKTGRIESLVYAILILSIVVEGITEFLSYYNLINRMAVSICWLVLTVLGLIFNVLIRNTVFFDDLRYSYSFFMRLPQYNKIIVLLVCAIYTGFLLLCPFIVNLNSDSLAYHLPRVMMWIQNHSVEYYISGYSDAQNLVPPLPDFFQMHVMLLSGSDRLQGGVQIICSFLCLIIMLRLSFEITHSSSVVAIGTVLYLSVPIIIRETNTTQSDLVASLYLICFVYIIYRISKENRLIVRDINTLFKIIAGGTALGLLYISKCSLLFSALAVLLWFGIKRLFVKKDRILDLLLLVFSAFLPFIILILPMILRNLSYGETALAGNHFSVHVTGSLLPQYLFLNAYKNWAELAATPVNADLFLSIGSFLGSIFGIDINADELKNSVVPFMTNIKWYMDEDLSGAPFYMMISTIAFIAWVLCLLFGKKNNNPDIACNDIGFLWVLFLQFIPLAMMTRWMPYGTRYMMPSLILTIIPISYILVSLGNKKLVTALLFIGFIISIPCYFQAIKGAGRILSGKVRYDDYYVDVTGFTGIPQTEKFIENNNCHNIGFYGYNCFAYPQFKVFMKPDRRVEYTIPENPIPGFIPDVIYSAWVQPYELGQIFEYNGQRYFCAGIYGEKDDEALFVRE